MIFPWVEHAGAAAFLDGAAATLAGGVGTVITGLAGVGLTGTGLTGAAVVEIGAWLFVRATMLVGLAWTVSRLGGRRAPVGHVAWSALLVALLALPLLTFGGAVPRLGPDVVPADWWEAGAATAPGARAGIRPDARGALSPMAPAPIQVDLPEWTPPAPRDAAPVAPWALAAVALWLAGVLLVLGRLAVRQWSLAIVARRASPWPDDATRRLFHRIGRELGIRRRVRLLEVPGLSVPACWGIVRPTVGLPPGARDWTVPHLRAALLHELAHVGRRDYVTLLLGELACAFYWPNPAVWWASARALSASETACDRTVLLHGTARHDYASLLVSAARDARRGGLRPRTALSMARGPDLRERIGGVLGFRPAPRLSRATLARLAALAVALSAAVASLGFGSDRERRLARALHDADADRLETRAAAARELGDLRANGSVATLSRLLGDPAPEVRGAAAHALAETGSRLATRPLMRRLDDPDPRVVEAVIFALGRTRDRRAYYDIEELTGTTDRRLRLAATWAIGEIKCEPAIRRLTHLLDRSADPKTRLAAARGLRGAPGGLVADALARATEDPDAAVRAAAAESLELIP